MSSGSLREPARRWTSPGTPSEAAAAAEHLHTCMHLPCLGAPPAREPLDPAARECSDLVTDLGSAPSPMAGTLGAPTTCRAASYGPTPMTLVQRSPVPPSGPPRGS